MAVRSADDPPGGSLFPDVLDHGKQVRLQKSDGANIHKCLAKEVSIYAANGDKYERVELSGNVDHTIVLTDTRIIIFAPNYKRASANTAAIGLPEFYVAETLIAKARTRNKALVGHVSYPTVSRIAARGAGGVGHPNLVRVYLSEKVSSETARKLILQVLLPLRTDPRPLALDIARRTASCHLKYLKERYSARNVLALGAMQHAEPLATSDSHWASYDLERIAMPLGPGQ